MSLPSLSVRRGVTFLMIFIMVVGFGIFSLARLRLDLYPDVSFPLVAVVTQYEGAGPREIEDLISRPIEGAVASVEGAKKVSSTSKQGVSIVMVEFEWGANLKQAEIDVRKFIDMMRDALPDEASNPIVFAINPSLQPVAFMAVRGPYPETKLREIAEEKIEPLLERVNGIAMADTVGGGKREIQIQIDPRRLAAAGVSPAQVVNALRAENVQLPGGSFDQGGWEFNIQTLGKFTSVRQIEEVVVGLRQGVATRVRDVAVVKDSLKEQTRLVRNDGRSGLMMMVRKQSDANTVQAVRGVKKALPEIQRKAGRGIEISFLFDQGDIIEKSIGNLGSTGLQAVALTFIVLLFFLRAFRPSLIVAASIPLSVLATFSMMDAMGLTLNIISMSGLALAIGMLVDNSIVVQESIYLHADAGKPPAQAAVDGAKEVNMAITASTLTTLVVFLPIIFVPGIAGKMFYDMTVTVCVSLMVSLLVALTAVPLASSRLLKRQAVQKQQPGRFVRALAGFQEWMIRTYASNLRWSLHHRKTIFLIVTMLFIGVMALAPRIPREFFPKQDSGLIIMQVEGQVGSSLEATEVSIRRMEKIVEEHVPERRTVNMDFGAGEGFIALFSKGSHSGIMRLKLKDLKDRKRKQLEIEEDLRRRFSTIPGITVTSFQPSFLGSAGDLVVQIFGHDLDQTRDVGMRIKEILSRAKGTADVVFSLEAGKPEYDLRLDRGRMAALGLSSAAVSSAVSMVFSGKLATTYQEGGYEYDIRVRGPKDFRLDERNLRGLPIVTPAGLSVPLSAIASVEPAVGPATITRQDQQRMATVTAAVPGKDLGGVLADVTSKLDRFPWPDGFNYHIGGTAEDFKDSFKWLGIALLFSILLVYMVMASQFESLLHPFVILFTIPLAFIGVVVILLATGTSLSVTAFIGVLILGGIVVNNAIVLLDYINQLRAQGTELLPAVIEGCKRRLRPVLMTAGTTVLGLLPLALEIGEGSEGWSPMARTVIGGLTVSTALTLLVIPTFYTSLETFREKRRKKREARLAASTLQGQPSAG
jgi:hydrophobic/amphiphilic exporter-1 (mainly G- bacteria), HAE1 family